MPAIYAAPAHTLDAGVTTDRLSDAMILSDPGARKTLALLSNLAENADKTKGQTYARKVWENEHMTEPLTRPELNAKLETIEMRMDGRISRIEDRIGRMEEHLSDIKLSMRDHKKSIWGAAVATITLLLAAMAFFVSSFDSGRHTAQMAHEAQTESAKAQASTAAALAEIRQIVSDLKQQPLATQQPAPPTQ